MFFLKGEEHIKGQGLNPKLVSPFSILLLGWGPLKARNFPGTIQLKSPFSTRYNRERERDREEDSTYPTGAQKKRDMDILL